jgi:hypothetical protein
MPKHRRASKRLPCGNPHGPHAGAGCAWIQFIATTEVRPLSRLRGRVWGGGGSANALFEGMNLPHPPRFARRPPPQAGEVGTTR